MELSTALKQKIWAAVQEARANFDDKDDKFATSLGIHKSQYSRIKHGEYDQVISDSKWITLARKFNVNLTNAPEWKIAKTNTFQFITAQLELCQQQSISSILCDKAGIGKTIAAKYYASTHKNVVYIDCSQVKTKQKFIRQIAKSFGLDSTGRYTDVYEDLTYYLKTLLNPLIILDEAGDLDYGAFLEIKALWNATDMICAFYMIGADGLKAKMQRSIDHKKVGYAEIFRRFGDKYLEVKRPEGYSLYEFLQSEASMIAKVNAPEGANINMIVRGTMDKDHKNTLPCLTRIRLEIAKLSYQ